MKILEKILQSDLMRQLFSKLGRLALIILLASLLMKLLLRSLEKIMVKDPENQKRKTLFTVVSSLVKYLIYFLMLTMILEVFGISTNSIVAVAGVGSVALGFGAQALVKDIISGLFILTENQYNVDDYVTIADYSGTVVEMSLRTTTLRTATGEQCIIPNGEIRSVKNYSKDYMMARVEVPIPYDLDLDQMIEFLEKHLREFTADPALLEPFRVDGVVELADSAVLVRLSAKCRAGSQWKLERDMRRFIKNLYDEHGIEIPFPSQTVYLKKD